MLCHDHTPGFVHKLKPFFQNKVLSSHHSYMTKKLINRWNERPSAFLQNPCASDLKLNKCATIRRHLCFFSNPDFTQLQFKFTNGSTGYPSSGWEVDDGREKEFPVNMLYSSIFLLKCPVKFSPVLSNDKVSPVSPPLSSPAWWRTMQVYRWEQLPKRSLRLFSLQKTGK